MTPNAQVPETQRVFMNSARTPLGASIRSQEGLSNAWTEHPYHMNTSKERKHQKTNIVFRGSTTRLTACGLSHCRPPDYCVYLGFAATSL
jgi:hypothetical protein